MSCGANGILIEGHKIYPDVRGNIISQSRKTGIKLTHNSQAHIGGNEKEDIELLPEMKTDAQDKNDP